MSFHRANSSQLIPSVSSQSSLKLEPLPQNRFRLPWPLRENVSVKLAYQIDKDMHHDLKKNRSILHYVIPNLNSLFPLPCVTSKSIETDFKKKLKRKKTKKDAGFDVDEAAY